MLKDNNKLVVKPKPLNESEKEWIRNNFHNTPVKQMAIFLNRTPSTIYYHLDSCGLAYFSAELTRKKVTYPGKFFNVNEFTNWLCE